MLVVSNKNTPSHLAYLQQQEKQQKREINRNSKVISNNTNTITITNHKIYVNHKHLNQFCAYDFNFNSNTNTFL